MPSDMIKVARLEVQMANVEKTLNEIKGHQESRAVTSNSQYTETVKLITALSTNMENYQRDCSNDRKEYNERILENSKNISDLRNEQSLLKGQAAGISLLASGVISALGVAVAWFHK